MKNMQPDLALRFAVVMVVLFILCKLLKGML